MNNVNRGVIKGVSYSLENAKAVLSAIAEKEDDKEQGFEGGAPTSGQFGTYSGKLRMAIQAIGVALECLQESMPDYVDFEEYMK